MVFLWLKHRGLMQRSEAPDVINQLSLNAIQLSVLGSEVIVRLSRLAG
jgi:hypothetical protein